MRSSSCGSSLNDAHCAQVGVESCDATGTPRTAAAGSPPKGRAGCLGLELHHPRYAACHPTRWPARGADQSHSNCRATGVVARMPFKVKRMRLQVRGRAGVRCRIGNMRPTGRVTQFARRRGASFEVPPAASVRRSRTRWSRRAPRRAGAVAPPRTSRETAAAGDGPVRETLGQHHVADDQPSARPERTRDLVKCVPRPGVRAPKSCRAGSRRSRDRTGDPACTQAAAAVQKSCTRFRPPLPDRDNTELEWVKATPSVDSEQLPTRSRVPSGRGRTQIGARSNSSRDQPSSRFCARRRMLSSRRVFKRLNRSAPPGIVVTAR